MIIDIVELGKIITALGAIAGVVFAVYKFFRMILDRIKKLESEEKKIETTQHDHIEDSAEEFLIIIKGLSACLDGLTQMGCNHTVTTCKEEIDQFLLAKSHRE
ncbi:MAG: hypothetical protein IKK84_00135 [Clostridia bacterium]|nr:hypothetical protein [Clostridia bacterium]